MPDHDSTGKRARPAKNDPAVIARVDRMTGRSSKILGRILVGMAAFSIVPLTMLMIAGAAAWPAWTGILFASLAGFCIVGGLIGGAIAAAWTMAGASGAWIGLVFVVGFVGLATGSVLREATIWIPSAIMLVSGVAGFYALGGRSGLLPERVGRVGELGSLLAGVVFVVVAVGLRVPILLVLGICQVGAFTGFAIARRRTPRRGGSGIPDSAGDADAR